jgi:hypothetical protein
LTLSKFPIYNFEALEALSAFEAGKYYLFDIDHPDERIRPFLIKDPQLKMSVFTNEFVNEKIAKKIYQITSTTLQTKCDVQKK